MTATVLLPFLFMLGAGTLFVGAAVIFGVWLPQWVLSRRLPVDDFDSIDDAASTGRFTRIDVDD